MARPIATSGASMVSLTRELVWDATITESYSLKSDVTENEVEDGASTSDHARLRQAELTLDLIATTSPLNGEASSDDRDRQFRGTLQEMWAARELVTIISELVDADDWLITGIDESADSRTGEACVPRVTLRRLRFASRQTVQIPPLPVNERRISQTIDTGAQAAGDGTAGDDAAADAELERNETALYNEIYGDGSATPLDASFVRSFLGLP